MIDKNTRLNKIVIVGGGSAGWIAAASLAKALQKNDCKITLIESPDIKTIGVGEATIPPIVNFLQFLGIDEREFMVQTQASFKLAIQFVDWREKGSSFFHPFGTVGVNIDGQDFYSCWLKAKTVGSQYHYTSFSPSAHMCEQNKFYFPYKASKESFLAGAAYAYHFDAGLLARYLEQYSINRGVEKKSANVEKVQLDERGFIASLGLKDGSLVEGDFFIDCTGFKGLLIEEALQTGYTDWTEWLPCDRAIAVQTENSGPIIPYTKATARDSGWTWKIPLQTRTGNGYVFCSKFCSDDEARATLLSSVEGECLIEPKVIPFATGHRNKIWNKNCLALGLSSGFLEPLESTAIHLVTRGMRAFLDYFPDRNCDESLANEYNRIMLKEYETIRDFIVLHYCTTRREDSAFWNHCREMSIPHTLQRKIELYKSRGLLEFSPDDLFKPPSWYSLFEGMGVQAESYSPFVDPIEVRQLSRILDQVNGLMGEMANGLPTHDQFLQKYCPVM